jgi:hypothetical protein
LLAAIHASGRTAMLQPFLPSVDARGERALFYAGGASPTRSQGRDPASPGEVAATGRRRGPADHRRATPSPAERALADRAMRWLQERLGPLAYARVDLLDGPDGAPVVLELELAEPVRCTCRTRPGDGALRGDVPRAGVG